MIICRLLLVLQLDSLADASYGTSYLSVCTFSELHAHSTTQHDTGLRPLSKAGKLGRVEEERREYYEEMVRLSDLVRSHEVAAKDSDEKLQQLEATLASSTAESASQLETANRREQVNLKMSMTYHVSQTVRRRTGIHSCSVIIIALRSHICISAQS